MNVSSWMALTCMTFAPLNQWSEVTSVSAEGKFSNECNTVTTDSSNESSKEFNKLLIFEIDFIMISLRLFCSFWAWRGIIWENKSRSPFPDDVWICEEWVKNKQSAQSKLAQAQIGRNALKLNLSKNEVYTQDKGYDESKRSKPSFTALIILSGDKAPGK